MAENKEAGIEELDNVVIRFAGDSGDGMQLTGNQFTNTAAYVGNDISTFPDFPAEIRAPAGSLAGVSGFQINFSSYDVRTPGDTPTALVAMNPAALKINIEDLAVGGIIIANSDGFEAGTLKQAGYETNPLEDEDFQKRYHLYSVPITKLTQEALENSPLSFRVKERSKNFFALGLVYWLYSRPLEPTIEWIEKKFGKNEAVVDANLKTLKAGYYYGETTESFEVRYIVRKADIEKGHYRKINGSEAMSLGLVAAATKAKKELFYSGYPITPASEMLHELAKLKHFGVKVFQAEDEIAAIGIAIGASYTGSLAVTGSSGPGIALKTEFMGLAAITELPLIIINVQRGGPSTGLPTKTEQSDLLQVLFGRNGECPIPVIAPTTPGDCFDTAIEATKIATKYMMPVIILSDLYLAFGAEPWKVPHVDGLSAIDIKHPNADNNGDTFMPYSRNGETYARPWAIPGTAGLEHRIGGLEKADITGSVSYDPDNHQHMTELRYKRLNKIADDIPQTKINGDPEGDLLVVGWGSTYGAISSAVDNARKEGKSVSSIQIRHLNPLPADLEYILKKFKKVLVPELNTGQLSVLIQSKYLIETIGLNKVTGKPFQISDIAEKIKELV